MGNPFSDGRRIAPAVARNREPILAILRRALPAKGTVLEIASGTGEHAAYFARALPGLDWQPSDPSPEACASIQAWVAAEQLANLRPPIALDVGGAWPEIAVSALLCINMVHISPWPATEALMHRAGTLLPSVGLLYIYGPFHRDGFETAASNLAFDADLQRRNPAWGLRDLDKVMRCAAMHGLQLDEIVEMPANNLSLLFRKEQHHERSQP